MDIYFIIYFTIIKAKITVYFLSQHIDLPTHFSPDFHVFKNSKSALLILPRRYLCFNGKYNSKNKIRMLIVLHNKYHSHKAYSRYGLLSEKEVRPTFLLNPHTQCQAEVSYRDSSN